MTFPLEEGDTGEALLPDLLNHDDDAPGEVVQPLLELAQTVGRSPSALMVNQTGLPGHLERLNQERDEIRQTCDAVLANPVGWGGAMTVSLARTILGILDRAEAA